MEIKVENISTELNEQIKLYNKSLNKLAGAVKRLDELNASMDKLDEKMNGINTNGKEIENRISFLRKKIKSIEKLVNKNKRAIERASSTTEVQQLESQNMSAYEHYYNYSIELRESREWLNNALDEVRALSVIEIPKAKQEIDDQKFVVIEMTQIVSDFARELNEKYGLNIDFECVDKQVQEKVVNSKAKVEIEPVELVSGDENFK